jgi:hypothetical protein
MGQLADCATVPATARRSKDGRITTWSAGMESRYGFTSAQAVGQISSELLRTIFEQPRREVERELTELGHWRGNVVNHHSDGRAVPTFQRWDRQAGAGGGADIIHDEHRDPAPDGMTEIQLFVAAIAEIARELSEALTAVGAYNVGATTLLSAEALNPEALQRAVGKQAGQVARAAACIRSLRHVLNNHRAAGPAETGQAIIPDSPHARAAPLDAALAEALDEWVRFEQEIKAAMELPEQTTSHRDLDAILAPLFEGQHALVDRLCDLQARTPGGHTALARVILLMDRDDFDSDSAPWSLDQQDRARMVSALLRNLARAEGKPTQ